jgi:hypothetical protein
VFTGVEPEVFHALAGAGAVLRENWFPGVHPVRPAAEGPRR